MINFHVNGNYPSQKIDWKKYEYFKKSNFIYVQKTFDSWFRLTLGYLWHQANLGKLDPYTGNGLGYKESNAKANFHSSISGDRFKFCNQFFNLGMCIYDKIEKSIHESKFVHQAITKSRKYLQEFFFPINFLNLKTNQIFFWSNMNMWFHITGNCWSFPLTNTFVDQK